MIYLSALVHVSLPSTLIYVVAMVMIATHIAPLSISEAVATTFVLSTIFYSDCWCD